MNLIVLENCGDHLCLYVQISFSWCRKCFLSFKGKKPPVWLKKIELLK